MNELIDLVKDVAPGVATLLGGPLAGGVVSFLGDHLLGNASASISDVIATVKDPSVAVQLKQLDTQLKIASLNKAQDIVDDSTKLDLAQNGIVQAEVSQPGIFGKWHDALGWMCILVLGFDTIGVGIASMFHISVTSVPLTEFLPILMTIIGARTFEKFKGVQ